jgi:flagellar biosynthesis/type III secretory pathway protein FliH
MAATRTQPDHGHVFQLDVDAASQGKAFGPKTVRACSGHLTGLHLQPVEAIMPIDETAEEAVKEAADEAAKEVAEEAAKEAAEEAYRKAYDRAYREAYEEAYKEAYESALENA